MNTLSGYCNPSWPLHTVWGRASHARCHKADCPCECGHKVTHVAEPLCYAWCGTDEDEMCLRPLGHHGDCSPEARDE